MTLLYFRYSSRASVYSLHCISNQDFTETEFKQWRETMLVYNTKLPTLQDVRRKLYDINFAFNNKFREEDIDAVSTAVLSC